MTKHWMTKKAIVVMFDIKPHHLDKLKKNGAVRTRTIPRKEGQRGRNPLVYNCADVKAFLKMNEKERKIALSVSKYSHPLSAQAKADYDYDSVGKYPYTSAINHKWPKTNYNKVHVDEMVNHPKHYNPGKIEVIDAIEDWQLDFNEGNVIKYIVRAKRKNDRKQDLEKALWYIQRMLDNL